MVVLYMAPEKQKTSAPGQHAESNILTVQVMSGVWPRPLPLDQTH